MRCCICGCNLEGYGNNPQGACWKDQEGTIVEPEFDADDRCCDMCNTMYVIPGRLYRMRKNNDSK